jgi:hypothetical protein
MPVKAIAGLGQKAPFSQNGQRLHQNPRIDPPISSSFRIPNVYDPDRRAGAHRNCAKINRGEETK